MESLGSGLAVVDTAGKFLLFNASARRLFGLGPGDPLPSEAIIKQGVFLPDGVTPFPVEEMPLVRAMRGESTGETVMFVKNERLARGAYVSVVGTPVRDEAGRLVGGLALFRDVTEARHAQDELRHTEEQLRQAQKMEAVGRLAGGVAHDFNNLLTVIISHARLARMDVAPLEAIADDLDEITKAAERAATLTRQLLGLQPPAGLRARHRRPQRARRGHEPAAAAPHRRRRVARDDALPRALPHSRRPGQRRAGHHEPGGERARRDARGRPAARRDRAGPRWPAALRCRNLGCRPATTSRSRSPTPAWAWTPRRRRGCSSRSSRPRPKGKGTGLGLSTVYGIVQQSGGELQVRSAPGEGSTFTILFPRDDGEPAHPSPQPTGDSPRGTETVLLVEDDEQVRGVTRGVLERAGYTVLEARDGVEALRRAGEHPGRIDLLLTDLEMPRMGGAELSERLRRERPETRLLSMSGYTDNSAVRRAIVDAQLDYLQKPLTPEGLARKVRAVLDAPLRPLPSPKT